MREKKYQPDLWHFPELDSKWWFKAWNHPANPFGNYLEPMPFPAIRYNQGKALRWNKVLGETFGMWLWWSLRNFASNAKRHWIGIVPVGERYEWVSPDENGWERVDGDPVSYWKKGWIRLPYFNRTYDTRWRPLQIALGWKDSGTLGGALRLEGKL